jgi:putative flippase GtrA
MAQLISNIASIFFNYHTYSNYLFKDRTGSTLKFVINHFANYLLSALILKLILYVVVNPYLATTLTLLVAITINYFVLKNIIFKKSNYS